MSSAAPLTNAKPLGNPAHLLPVRSSTHAYLILHSDSVPLQPSWTSIITAWLAEDTPSFDYGGFVVGEQNSEAFLFGKQDGILAGVPFFDEVFTQLGCTVTWFYNEGDHLHPTAANPKLKVAVVRARCSGIATKSDRLLQAARAAGFKGIVAGTRKTTPGFRLVEKYGMLVGGIDPHRYDLSSMVMLKDNHIWSKGSITEAVKAAKSVAGFALRIDVECTSEAEAVEAIEAGADVIMLDNFSPQQISESSLTLKDRYRDRRFLIEVSGGITEENITAHVFKGVDILSTSSAHQSVPHVDFSLKIQPKAD